MKWTQDGWDADVWERGEPYDKWRREATVAMIEKYAARRGQKEEPAKKPAPKPVKAASIWGDMFK